MFSKLIFLVFYFTLPSVYCQVIQADPTKPSNIKEQTQASDNEGGHIALEAVMVNEFNRKAIINGVVFFEMQEKSGIKVVSITTDKVEIEYTNNGITKKETLSLSKSDAVTKTAKEQQ